MTDLEPMPADNPLVKIGAALVALIIAGLTVVMLCAVLHLANLSHDISQATDETGYQLTGYGKIVYYIRDVVTLALGLVMVFLMARTVVPLGTGSSSSRTRALILAGLTTLMCIGFDAAWGPNMTVSTAIADSNEFTSRIEALQTGDMPSTLAAALKVGAFGVPILALCLGITLLAPPTTRYFQAMRRAGRY
ncbi:MAG TPA: hypothetical protein VFR11_21890 [Micromonosporaceae bacterium]|nr:hypothetical protein [Micromonosporaceae bacterium]